jgi:hypothetical protein
MSWRLQSALLAGVELLYLTLTAFAASPQLTDSVVDDEPRYDPATVRRYAGTVIAVTVQRGRRGILVTRAILTTRDGIVHIHLGPSLHLAERMFHIANGDFLTVAGSWVPEARAYVLIAREVTKGTEFLLLRSDAGRPLWEERAK